MHPRLADLARKYVQIKGQVSDLESQLGYLSLTARTGNDLRHIMDHTLLGLAAEIDGDSEQADYLYAQGIEHLREHGLNSYENVAGMALREAWEKLESAGFFTDKSQATDLHERARKSYSLGRRTRTSDESASLAHFRRAAELAVESQSTVTVAPPYQRFNIRWAIFLGLLALANVALILYQILSPS